METHKKETALVIEKVKQLTNDPNILASIETLLNIIPFAGGALSTILSEYRGRRNAKRILETLDELRNEIERNSSAKKDILSQDEVIELVHNTIEEIVKTSNDEKVGYLRNSLVRAFTNEEISYPQKQHYLAVLKDLTLGELELLKVIYLSGDPFDHRYNEPRPIFDPQSGHISATYLQALQLARDGIDTFALPAIDEYTEPASGDTLRDVLKQKLSHISEGAVEGLTRFLDSKGLSNIEPNLEGRTIKISKRRDLTQLGVIPMQNSIATFQLSKDIPTKTPIEASRTKFGEDFIQYIRSKY